jgi:hypothetical protein
LDIVEASNRMGNGGAVVPEAVVWGTWTFPLPYENSSGSERGKHLAWTALQMGWSDYASNHKICQITHPDSVHQFIADFPGLPELCIENPGHVACYAPQLTLPEFSGFLGHAFDDEMSRSVDQYRTRSATNDRLCDEEWCLRHPQFGGYKASAVAHQYFSGQMFAPKVEGYEQFEYIVWLLSDHSGWLPKNIREILISGSVEWSVWAGGNRIGHTYDEKGLLHALLHRSRNQFKFTKSLRASLEKMVDDALTVLGLQSDVQAIADAFIKAGYVEGYYKMDMARRSRR